MKRFASSWAALALVAFLTASSRAATETTGAAALVNPGQPEFIAPETNAGAETTVTQAFHGPRTISADASKVQGPLKDYFRACVGSDHPVVGLRADFQRDLKTAHEECGFKFLRCHGVLSDDMGVCKRGKDGKLVYNWMYVDSFYDYLLSNDMKPFVELGFMPEDMATSTSTIFWWKGNTSPPQKMEEWGELITTFTQHLTERYGPEEVRKWYFEVWNEPNIQFWRGTREQYFELYETSARAIKSVDPAYRVGGPGSAGPKWISELIAFCAERAVPLNFISTHSYAAHSRNKIFDRPGTIVDQVKEARDLMSTSPIHGLELHITEWGPSPSFKDVRHDSYRCAAFILAKVKRSAAYADSLSYWTVSDNFEEGGPDKGPFVGNFGLINFQGIRKAAFFAFKYLNELGGEELESADPDSYVTRDKDGSVKALFWDYSPAHDGDEGPVVWRRNDPPEKVGPITLELKSLTPGGYRLSVHRVGYRKNDPFSGYKDMQSPANLSKAQVQKLQEMTRDQPDEEREVTVGKGGKFIYQSEMRQNDCVLVTLTPEGAKAK